MALYYRRLKTRICYTVETTSIWVHPWKRPHCNEAITSKCEPSSSHCSRFYLSKSPVAKNAICILARHFKGEERQLSFTLINLRVSGHSRYVCATGYMFRAYSQAFSSPQRKRLHGTPPLHNRFDNVLSLHVHMPSSVVFLRQNSHRREPIQAV